MRDFAPLLACSLRSNPAYEVVVFDRLAPELQARLKEFRSDPNFYGVLRRRTSTEPAKAVDRETALLFLTLREAGPLPAYALDVESNTGRSIAGLVADGVLEVEIAGRFVSGTAALDAVAPRARSFVANRISNISEDALRYAQALPIDDPAVMAQRIYAYNRLPVTPQWRNGVPKILLQARAELEQNWQAPKASLYWTFWNSRVTAKFGSELPTFKLYISPMPETLRENGFGAIVSSLTACGAFQFKVGAGEAGLLRPDKIVAYFSDFDALSDASARIADRLRGMPAHGVPFTAEITGDGLVSWGVDPPRNGRTPWNETRSWREWVSQRLATAIVEGRSASAREPWRFALERLEIEGVDTGRWIPRALMFERNRNECR